MAAEIIHSHDFKYQFILDANGNATITGYHGDDSLWNIPREIDGHKVICLNGNAAFSDSINSAFIPQELELFDGNPFSFCENLSNIYVPSEHPRFSVRDGVLYDKVEKKIVCCPRGLRNNQLFISKDIRIIGQDAFANNDSLVFLGGLSDSRIESDNRITPGSSKSPDG